MEMESPTGAFLSIDQVSIPPFHALEEDGWRSDHPIPSDEIQTELLETRAKLTQAILSLEQIHVPDCNDHIQQEVEYLRTRIAKIDSTIAPHKKLPFEVLARIFAQYRSHVIRIPRKCSDDTPEFVCSRWTKIVYTTPAMRIRVSLRDGEEGSFIIDRARQILAEGGRKLTLFSERGLTNFDACMTEVCKALFFGQIEKLSVEGHAQFPLQFYQSSKLFGLQSVKSLTISELRVRSTEPGVSPNAYVLQHPPSLEWHHLQGLMLTQLLLPVPIAHTILSMLPHLKTCQFSIFPISEQFPTLQAIMLPNLVNLDLTPCSAPWGFGKCLNPEALACFLQPLHLPALTRLLLPHIRPWVNVTEPWPTILRNWFNQSCQPLEKFILLSSHLRVDERDMLVDILSTFHSSLRVLKMRGAQLSDELMTKLADGRLFPQLHQMSCKVAGSPSAINHFFDMLDSRAENIGRSRAISIAHIYCLNPEPPNTFRKLKTAHMTRVDQYQRSGNLINCRLTTTTSRIPRR